MGKPSVVCKAKKGNWWEDSGAFPVMETLWGICILLRSYVEELEDSLMSSKIAAEQPLQADVRNKDGYEVFCKIQVTDSFVNPLKVKM